jgi:hypothetical protein
MRTSVQGVGNFSLSLALWTVAAFAQAPHERPARVEVSLTQTAAEAPPLGCNAFGDPGGTSYSAGNLIPDGGFEPMSIRKRVRVTQTGVENGVRWFTFEGGGGMSDWDRTAGGFLSGADVRAYRIVDAQGQTLPPSADDYLDLSNAVEYRLLGETKVIDEGAPGFPQGGWVYTAYAQPNAIAGTRANLNYTDAVFVENGSTYYYIVTAIGNRSSEVGGDNESDQALSAEVTATPGGGLPASPHIFLRSGDGFNEIGAARSNDWFEFRPSVTGASGTVVWSLLDTNGAPLTLPAGLSFDTSSGSISGTPSNTPAPFHLRLRATATNGTATRDFILNNPDWTVDAGAERPLPPSNVVATSANGYVHLSWSPSPSANVVGYRVYRSEVPRAEQRQQVYLETNAPALAPWDYVHLAKRVLKGDPDWSHPRLKTGRINETWSPLWDSIVELERVAHPGTLPPEFLFPGNSCLRFTAPSSGSASIAGAYIFYPEIPGDGESAWYGILEPGRTYRYEAWMRQEGLGSGGEVVFTFNSMYSGISHTFQVDDQWRLHGFEFVAPAAPTNGSHDRPAIYITGPGTLWLDNLRLFRADTAQDVASIIAPPSPLVFDELLASQPTNGAKGIIRQQPVLQEQSTMAGSLGIYRDAGLILDWFQSVSAPYNMTVPFFLNCAFRTGDSPETRMPPWLNVSSHKSEAEWLMLIEYLGAPIDPNNPSDVAAKPWAYLRYRQRGVTTPWTDEFSRIYLEFANETWHNGQVSDEWFGWGRDGWVFDGSIEFGLVADYYTKHIIEHSPYYTNLNANGKLRFVMGSSYGNYAEIGAAYAPDVHDIAHTTYVGPRWEVGEQPLAAYDDHGIQATLLGSAAETELGYVNYRRWREELAEQGLLFDIQGYEGGPSGYSLPGQDASPEAHEYSERYGKSIAMAVASLDAWLAAYEYGFVDQAYLGFAPGAYWSSHTGMNEGYRPHAGWLALTLRNRQVKGRMIRAAVAESPVIAWDETDYPLVASYAFRDGNRLHVFLLSRKLGGVHDGLDWGDGSTPVTLVLPANPTGPATLYSISGDPRDTNRDALDVQIQQTATNLSRETAVSLPEGAIYLYVVDTDLPDRDDPPPPPCIVPVLAHGAAGTTITWPAGSNATHYVIYRSPQPFFNRADVKETFTTASTTYFDDGAVGGTRYYYRVAAANGWGTGVGSVVAAGGTNNAVPILAAPPLHGLMEQAGMLIAEWDAVANATGYRVGVATQTGGPYSWHDAGIATSWTLTGLDNGRAYYVVVHAYNAQGRGPESTERQGMPTAPGEAVVLAAWDGATLLYADTNNLPTHMPCVRHVLSLSADDIALSSNLTHSFDDYGYGIGTGSGGQGTIYDGSLTFAPRDDSANFGAPGGGSLSNVVAREAYLVFSFTPVMGQGLSVQSLETGFKFAFGAGLHQFALRYRVGGGDWHTVSPQGYAVTPGWENCNDVALVLTNEAALQGVTQPVEMRFYFYSTNSETSWHPASLVRCSGEDVILRGQTVPVAVPGQPRNVLSQSGTNAVALAWTPVAGADTYVVRWGREPGVELGAVTGLVQAATTIAHLAPAFHWFTVQAQNAFGQGTASPPHTAWGGSPPAIQSGTFPGEIYSLILSSNLAGAVVERTTNLLASSAHWQAIPATSTTNGSGELEYQLPIEHLHSFFRIKLTP